MRPILVSAALALAGCTASSSPARPSTHDVQTVTVSGSSLLPPAPRSPLVLDSVSLRRTPCYGSCPAYVVVFRADGTAEWRGERNVERMGVWTAHTGDRLIHRLGYVADRLGVMEMEPVYHRFVTDVPAAEVRLWVRGAARPKVVREDFAGEAGPTELWAFQGLMDGLAGNLRWTQGSAP